MGLQERTKLLGIKQKFLAEKFGTTETNVSIIFKYERLFKEIEAYVKQVEEL